MRVSLAKQEILSVFLFLFNVIMVSNMRFFFKLSFVAQISSTEEYVIQKESKEEIDKERLLNMGREKDGKDLPHFSDSRKRCG